MNVLSLFDGMSCGQIALDQLGVKVDNYYASEIDKYAIKVTQKNYPNTKQIGSVTEVKGKDLPKIDLIICGSPCQGFSFAGKQLNFNDPRSALFFQFVRLLRECKPKYFLLENVRMKKEYQEIISEHLGVEPVMINSALVSAQNRVRLYWTNIPGIEQPEDKGIVLKDILEDFYENPVIDQLPRGANKGGITASSLKKGKTPSLTTSSWQHNNHLYELKEFNKDSTCHHAATATDIKGNESMVDRTKSYCLDANYFKGGNLKSYFEKHRRQLVFLKDGLCHVGDADLKGNDSIKRVYASSAKSPTLTTMGGGHREPKVLCGRIVGRKINPNTGKRDDYNPDLKAEQRLEPRLDEKSGTLTTVQKDNVLIVPEATKKGFTEIQDGDCFDATYINSKTRRGRNMKYKSNCLTATNYDYMKYEHPTYRKLTPLECERLQTVPDGYTSGVSNTQRYKLLGNGFTVDVIKHILQEMIQ